MVPISFSVEKVSGADRALCHFCASSLLKTENDEGLTALFGTTVDEGLTALFGTTVDEGLTALL